MSPASRTQASTNASSVAVIGAGLAGIACARRMAAAGLHVQVFESQRSAGGRLATRRFEATSFDHGAQYLTVSDPAFRQVVDEAASAGAAGRWHPRWAEGGREGRDLWVGTPGMSALPRLLAQGLEVEYGARILRLERERRGWTLVDARGSAHPGFGFVALALPAPAAADLAASHSVLAAQVRAVPMAPCWAVMAAWESPLGALPDAGFDAGGTLAWYARNASKPGRDGVDAWVLHAGADWSRREFDAEPARVQKALLERFAALAGRALPRPALLDSHRWRHARVEDPLGDAFLLDEAAGIGFCGDWCLDARGEAAYLSGEALGAAVAEARRAAGSGKMRGSR